MNGDAIAHTAPSDNNADWWKSFLKPEPWMESAKCAEIGGDWWFPDKGERADEARAICRACPVAAMCLEYALRTNQKHGIYGGLSGKSRAHLARKRAAA